MIARKSSSSTANTTTSRAAESMPCADISASSLVQGWHSHSEGWVCTSSISTYNCQTLIGQTRQSLLATRRLSSLLRVLCAPPPHTHTPHTHMQQRHTNHPAPARGQLIYKLARGTSIAANSTQTPVLARDAYCQEHAPCDTPHVFDRNLAGAVVVKQLEGLQHLHVRRTQWP